MSYLIVCKKQDGSLHVAAHPGEASPEMLQDAQPAESVEEAAEMVKAVLGDAGSTHTGTSGETDPPADGDAAPPGAEGMPMETSEDHMEAGFQRAKRGY
jgi:hypothetical protein